MRFANMNNPWLVWLGFLALPLSVLLHGAESAAADPGGKENAGAKKEGEQGGGKGNEKPGKEKEVQPAPRVGPTGVFGRYQLTARMFKRTRDYFSKSVGGKMLLRYYSRYQYCCEPRRAGRYSPRDFLKYEVEKQVALLAVPKNYDGKPGWGILLHIADNNAVVKDATRLVSKELMSVLEKRKLIYLMPLGFSTGQPDVRRMGICLDALATVMQEYPVDKGQVILSGTRGGALIAGVLLLDFPKLFCGMICQERAPMLSRIEKRATYRVYNLPDNTVREYWESDAPWMDPSRHKKVRRCKPRVAFFRGSARGSDAERLFCAVYTWAKYDYDYIFLDLPRNRGSAVPVPWLEKIVEWIRTGKQVEGLPLPNYERYKIRMPVRKRKR